MAKGIFGGEEFDLPEREYTGRELQGLAGAAPGDVPVVRDRSGERDDYVVGPGEKVRLGSNDAVTFTTPMEAA